MISTLLPMELTNENEEEPVNNQARRYSRSLVRRCARNSVLLPPSTVSLFILNGEGRRSKCTDRILFPISDDHLPDRNGEILLGIKNNNNRNYLSFKVKTTSNRFIRVRPSRGILSPEDEGTVRLRFKYDDSVPTDLVVVVTAIIIEDGVTDAIAAWQEADQIAAPMWKQKLDVGICEKKLVEDQTNNGENHVNGGENDDEENLASQEESANEENRMNEEESVNEENRMNEEENEMDGGENDKEEMPMIVEEAKE